MAYKLNVFTGTLDIVGTSSGGSGSGVTRVGPTNDRRITRWAGNSSDTIQNSQALVQDGGAIEAQGFITSKLITDTITIHGDQVMITSGFSIEPTGELVIEADGELVVL